AREKITVRVRARIVAPSGPLAAAAGAEVDGYEIHAGRTELTRPVPRVFAVLERGGRAATDLDGAIGDDGLVFGTYLHGVLAGGEARRALLAFVARRAGRPVDEGWGNAPVGGAGYDSLADAVEDGLDMKAIAALVGLTYPA